MARDINFTITGAELEAVEEFKTKHRASCAYKNSKTTNRKIEVDIDGRKQVFNSISEASRALGVSRDTIRKYNSKNNIKWKLI